MDCTFFKFGLRIVIIKCYFFSYFIIIILYKNISHFDFVCVKENYPKMIRIRNVHNE